MSRRSGRGKQVQKFSWLALTAGFCIGRSSTLFNAPWLGDGNAEKDISVVLPSAGGGESDDDDDSIRADDNVAVDFPMETTDEVTRLVGQWPSPLIVVGLPKAGTNSIAEYFRCGGIEKVAHHKCLNRACGAIIQKNVLAGRSPLMNTGRADVYVQIDVELNVDKGLPCYFPQIEALDAIHTAHPNSTFLLNTREINAWVRSVRKWAQMDSRLSKCNITGLPAGKGMKERELKRFFSNQQLRIKRFVERHPSHRLVKVQIDLAEAGEHMEGAFGIDRKCWGHHNKQRQQKPRPKSRSH